MLEGQLLTVLPEPDVAPGPADRARLRAALQLGPDDFAALRIARLFPDKGVDDLLRFVAGLRARGIPAVGLIVGDGPEEPKLAAEAARLGIAEHIRFLGFRRDLAALHAAADVTVVTSRYDAMCQAVIDAMAHRLPVIAYDIGCIDLAIEDGTTGILVPLGDIDRLVDAGARLRARAGRPGCAGRCRAARRAAALRARWVPGDARAAVVRGARRSARRPPTGLSRAEQG